MTNPRHFLYVTIALLSIGLITVVLPLFMVPRKPTKARKELFQVKKVIDGDTIELEDGQKVRYVGIDAPEVDNAACFAREAKERNKGLVEGKSIELERDVSEKDQYGRLLRYTYADGVMVNEVLVKEGYVQAMRVPPDVRFADSFRESEQEARRAGRGLWSSCKITVITGQVLGLEATSSAR